MRQLLLTAGLMALSTGAFAAADIVPAGSSMYYQNGPGTCSGVTCTVTTTFGSSTNFDGGLLNFATSATGGPALEVAQEDQVDKQEAWRQQRCRDLYSRAKEEELFAKQNEVGEGYYPDAIFQLRSLNRKMENLSR
jgi:hypothetical protein